MDDLIGTLPRLAAGGYNPPEASRALVLKDLSEQLLEAEIFVVDNVADYWERSGGSKTAFKFDDFPNLAPPFPLFFVEWAIHEESGNRVPDARIGVLFTTLVEDPDDGWRIELAPFIASSDGPVGPIDVLYLVIDKSGRLIDVRGPANADATRTDDMLRDHWHLVMPAMLAVCFLHCRKVGQRVVASSPRLNRARERRGRRPFLRYKVLVIEPMTSVLRTEGGSDTEGLARALHISRGHFKTYQERPLFGRLKGTWWWADHVRGAVEAGVITKDYAVDSPDAPIGEARAASRRSRGTRSRSVD